MPITSLRSYSNDDIKDGGRAGFGGDGKEGEVEPLNRIFQRAVILQRMGERMGCLVEYERFLQVARTNDVDPSLYAEVHANMGAVYAVECKGGLGDVDLADDDELGRRRAEMRSRAKHSLGEAVKYRPGLGSAWVNLALVILSEGKEIEFDGNDDGPSDGGMNGRVKNALVEARNCCVRALGMDNEDERSRSLANKLIGDIDAMMRRQQSRGLN
jgi:hypothetical protein